MHRVHSGIAATMTALLAGAVLAAEWPAAPQCVALLQAADASLDGWALRGDPATYTRSNLAELVGGAAAQMATYDYLWSVAGSFAGAVGAVATELHRFETDLHAFGALSLPRDPLVPGKIMALDRPTPPLSAYWQGSALHVWRGPFYARFVAQGGAHQEMAIEVASAVLGQLPPAPPLPALMRLAPERGMVLEAMRFRAKDVFGQPALRNALTVDYGQRLPGEVRMEMRLALFDSLTPPGAGQTFRTLQEYLRQAGIPRPIPALGQAAFVLRHPGHGQTYVMQEGQYVAVVEQVKQPQSAEGLLRTIGTSIRLGG